MIGIVFLISLILNFGLIITLIRISPSDSQDLPVKERRNLAQTLNVNETFYLDGYEYTVKCRNKWGILTTSKSFIRFDKLNKDKSFILGNNC